MNNQWNNKTFLKTAFFLAFLLGFTINVSGQFYDQNKEPKVYNIGEIFKTAIASDSTISIDLIDTVSTEGYSFLFGEGLYEDLIKDATTLDVDGRILLKGSISIAGIFSEDNGLIIIKNFHFKEPLVISSFKNGNSDKTIAFENCVFDSYVIIENFERISFLNNKFSQDLSFKSKSISFNDNQINEFISRKAKNRALSDLNKEIVFHSVYRNSLFWGRHAPIINQSIELRFKESLELKGNRIDSTSTLLSLYGEADELLVANNKINGILDISDVVINKRMDISGNTLKGYLDISRTVFPEVFRRLIFSDGRNFELCVGTKYPMYLPNKIRDSLENYSRKYFRKLESGDSTFIWVNTPYIGLTENEVREELIFDLKRSYLRLHELAKENTDLETANWAYATMMDLEGKKLRFEYMKNKNFTNYFRWQLNSLLKAYTNHGTDPAKSVVVSIYVMLIFAIFYFFFPSDWDISSKSKLISDFKEFATRKEHGFVKTLMKLVAGLSISLINAVTLSVNSFTTLGFGNIPTHGVAKYICIIQGFIGWFLLSLFTVALINQLLL